MTDSSEALDRLFELGRANQPSFQRPDGGLEILVPEGWGTHTIPSLDPALLRVRQQVTMVEAASFITYVNRFKTSNSIVFGLAGHQSKDNLASFTAVLDYHHEASSNNAPKPEHAAHVAIYKPAYSKAWSTWLSVGVKTQQEFGEFLEENRADVRDPLAAALIDLVNNLKLSKKVDYDSVVNRPNGDILLAFSEKTEQEGSRGNPMGVPKEIKLGLPVYFGGAQYAMTMLMRYRLNAGKVHFQLKADRPDDIEQDAFNELVGGVSEGTQLPVLMGRPS
jgi:uncharacterized protein YfdQ (DUF2303 family)